MKHLTIKGDRWAGSLLGVSLLVAAHGCGGSQPAPASESTAPAATQQSEGQAPPAGLDEPPPDPSTGPEGQPQPPAGSPAGPPEAQQGALGGSGDSSISDAEIETFAEIQLELASYQQELTQQAQQGADQTELQNQFRQRAEQLIQASSLSMARFDQIGRAVQGDLDLQRRVQKAIEQKQNTGG